MRIFGLEINRSQPVSKYNLEDASKEPAWVSGVSSSSSDSNRGGLSNAAINVNEVSLPKTLDVSPATIRPVRNPGYTYSSARTTGRGVFQTPEYDMALIGRIEDTDSYVRQAFKKKIGLMFKEGYDFVSPNPQRAKYIKLRLRQIEQATGIPTKELMRSIGSALVKKSNGFLVKKRNEKASGGKKRTTPAGKELKPVAGYFILPAEMMEVDADIFGRVRKWRQRRPDGQYKDFNPEDVVHFYFDRKEGFIFGTPTLVPVADDIRALRKIEENIELLVYQHLFPLFQYRVGTPEAPAGYTEDGMREIDVVKQEIEDMPTEGGIVTPERHEITAIGSEGRALRAENYLEHFKKRVFSGLGVSAVDMGEPDTSNKSTADNMSRNLVDDVKDFQGVFQDQFNQFIINELLLESTFNEETVLDEVNIVKLEFKEIDLDKKIKVETHAADQFQKNAITHDELREVQGREAWPIPDSEEDDDPNKYPEWNRSSWKLFDEPKALIQAVDEPYMASSMAAAANKNTSISSGNVNEAGEKATQAKEREVKARPTPPKRSSSDSIQLKDNFLLPFYNDIEENIISDIQNPYTSELSNVNYFNLIVRAQASRMTKRVSEEAFTVFVSKYAQTTSKPLETGELINIRSRIQDRASKYINRLQNSLISSLSRHIDSKNASDTITTVRAVFSSFRFRTKLISDVEVRRARNLGFVLAHKAKGTNKLIYRSEETECEGCLEQIDQMIDIKNITLDNLPPFHGACKCWIEVISGVNEDING